ncbi:MAG: hypothetical protein ACRD4L_04175, partial [Pyrinomonadaceae bacterium]
LEDAEESALVDTISIDHKCFNSHPIKHVLIVSPPVRISTAAAYRMLDISRLTFLTREPGAGKLSVSTSAQDINDSSDESFLNDFEEVILPAYPETIFARDALIKVGAGVARLCGSGSSIYGIFDNKYLLNEARILLKGMTGWSVSECRTVSRIEYKKEFGSCAKFLV